jgi:L-lactate dehydrogenase complex protein LldE
MVGFTWFSMRMAQQRPARRGRTRRIAVMSDSKQCVALFVTTLVDLYRPTVGFATIHLLEEAGCQVAVPRAQTCCGQPAYNSGDRRTTRDLARGIIEAFGGYDYVVVPSGSCGGMLIHHLPHLFDDVPNPRGRADALGEHDLLWGARGGRHRRRP